MKRRSSPTIRAQVIRGSFYLLLLVAATLLAFFPLKAPAKSERRSLTFAQRVGYQRAMEEVYWQHRIWPQANAVPKPSLEKVMSQTQIEKKVEDYLRNSQALEDYWQRPITPDQLQAEMERIANHTKQPGVLRELFAALGNDPLVIAECLTRPVLAERLLTELYAHDDRFHGELKRRAAAELRTHRSVKQMKQTSDTYTEMGWIKSDSAKEDFAPADAKSAEAVKMNSSEWQESVAKLAEQFGGSRGREAAAFGTRRHVAAFESADMAAHSKNAADDEYKTLPVGKLSLLREDEGHYYALAVTKKGKDRLKLATVAWLKEPLRSWLARAEAQMPATMATVSADYALPAISGQSDSWSPSVNCTNNTWTATSTAGAPAAREYHTAVWTGSEMIVWGGGVGPTSFNTGGRYNPSTDTWRATSTTNAPDGRYWHTAIWDGNVMIIWGGNNGSYLHTGGRYNPVTNSWTATSTFNTPAARGYHTAVWVGSQMIVWGGTDNYNYWNTGGKYNPSTNSWTATSTTNAPDPRVFHTAVWTGSQMIVWGGRTTGGLVNTGGKYCAQAPPTPTPTPTPTHTPTPTATATPTPVVTTSPATNVASFSATLNGSLNPHGLATTVYFEYGTTTSYGSTTANQTKTGNTYQNVAASISGLAAITAYHFRIVATNSAGTAYGSDRSFATFRKDESVAFQNNVVHDGSDPASPLVTPLTVKWRRNFSASGVSLISYPLIAEGRVFVTTTTSGPSGIETLMALDARTGSTLWSANVNGGFGFANAAYDSGRVFVVNYDGLAKAFDAATGTLLWSLLLPYPTLGCDAPPIAVNGRVYISGFGYGGDLYAVDETNGAVRWTMPVNTGDGSSPAVTSGRVFVYYACPESYAFNAATGQQVWYSYLCCGGGGGLTPVVHASRVYARASYCTQTNGVVLDANTGHVIGGFNSDTPPGFFGNLTLLPQSGTLVAVNSNGQVLWTFVGDGALRSAPLIVNQTIYIGSGSGMLYGLNASGQLIWSTQVGGSIPTPEQPTVTLVTGLGAGDGLLIVPTASTLVAYGN